jgi:hypothetical protein
MLKNINDLLAVSFFPMFLLWVIALALIVKFLDVSTITSLGLGTVTGVLIGWGSNIYQYYFRKAPPVLPTAPDVTKTPTPLVEDKKN